VANTSAGIQEGLYVWDGTQWVRPVTEIPNANQEAHRMALKASAPASTNAGVQLDFRDNNNNPLIIPESGTYVFAFRLYGSIGTGTGIRGYNISLREGSTEKVSSDIYFYKGAINNNYTYSILLASTFSAGTTVNVYLKNVSGNDAWTLSGNVSDVANRTSMVWWKL
jgi:hypothetical protein